MQLQLPQLAAKISFLNQFTDKLESVKDSVSETTGSIPVLKGVQQKNKQVIDGVEGEIKKTIQAVEKSDEVEKIFESVDQLKKIDQKAKDEDVEGFLQASQKLVTVGDDLTLLTDAYATGKEAQDIKTLISEGKVEEAEVKIKELIKGTHLKEGVGETSGEQKKTVDAPSDATTMDPKPQQADPVKK